MLKTLSLGILIAANHPKITLNLSLFFFFWLGVIFYTHRQKTKIALVLLLFFALLIPFRLAYLENVLVPPYFDSVTHIRIANAFLDFFKRNNFSSLFNLTDGYYHLGYHFIVSLLTLGLRADLMDVMPIFGQLILASIPIPVFFLVKEATNSDPSAFMSAFIAAFAWRMPLLAADWGKYPLLLSLFSFEGFLLLSYRFWQKKRPPLFWVIFAVLAALTIFIHSRMLILIAAFGIGSFLAEKITIRPLSKRRSLFCIQLGILLIVSFLTAKEPLLKLALEPYLVPASLLFVLPLPFALMDFPKESQVLIFVLIALLAGLYIPFPLQINLPSNLTLFDRPFTEISLYLPLALLSGLGFAGMYDRIRPLRWRQAFTAISLGLISIFLLNHAAVYPSGCCNLVGVEDIVILDWIGENLPAKARILVAANPIVVMPEDAIGADWVGSDAGIWIPYISHREIIPHSFSIDLSSPQTRQFLCATQAGYIYQGHNPMSFPQSALKTSTNYVRLISVGNAALYKIENCP